MTRVLVIEAAGNLWGSERSLLDLLSSVPRLEIAVCCPPGAPLTAELEKRRIRSLPYYVSGLHQKPRWQRMRAALGVLRACVVFRPDVIHLNQSGSYKVALQAARLLRIPIVAHVRIFEDAAYLAHQRPDARRLACVVAISVAVQKELRGFAELRGIPIQQIYNAYVCQRRGGDRVDRDRNRVACVGRIVPIKAQDILLEALRLLMTSCEDVRCLIVGDGDESFIRALMERADKNGTSSRLEWLGFVESIPPLLRTCSVLVCPSHREPLGRVILEAWDSGAVPVVFAGSGGAAEIVAAARGGIVYHEQTPESLANALRQALDLDVDERNRLVDNGRTWMAAHCSPAVYGDVFSTIMETASRTARRARLTRALIVEAAGNLWGSERSLLDLLAAVPDLNVAVCCPPDMPLTVELAKRSVPTLPYYVYGLHLKARHQRARAAFGVLRACLAFRPDVIHLNQSGSYKIALPAARLLRIPVVAHIRIFEDVPYLARQRPNPRLLRGVIAISRAVETEIGRYPELAGIPLHRIYDSYVPVAREADPEQGLKPRVACVGRLVPIKGQDVLMRALGLLDRQGTSVECLIAGEGQDDFLKELKRTASEERIQSSVRWLGFVQNIGPLLQTCRVLVCPSHREPLGRVIFEAWDAGIVPVVFAGSGGAAEIIAAADGGIVYDEQRPESLGKALRTVLDMSHEDAARLIENGRSWMATNCDAADYGQTVSAILARAGAPRHHPA